MRIRKLSVVSLLALGAVGCSGNDAVNIGDNPRAKTGETLSDYAASWEGYAEAYKFASGSDRIVVNLDAQGTGHIVFGDGTPPPPPPTDPDAWYPVQPEGDVAEAGFGFVHTGILYEGFAYTVQQAEVDARRLRFGFDPTEIYKPWCELQVPIPTDGSSAPDYGCAPTFTSSLVDQGICYYEDDSGGDPIEISCARLQLCKFTRVCSCTADGCTVPPLATLATAAMQLDAALEDSGNSLVGTLLLGSDGPTARLERH